MNVTAQAGDTLIQAGGTKPPDLQSAKRALRLRLRQQRKAIPQAICKKSARAVAKKVLLSAMFRRASRVAVYLSMGSEISTVPLITAFQSTRITVFAPAIIRGEMRFRPLNGVRLRTHALGMQQPRSGRGWSVSKMDVVIMPLLGFDKHGTRLGQGGGYYDRALSRCRFKPYRLGLAFACQEVDRLPRESFDQPLDAVATERGLLRFNRPLRG